MGVAEKHEDATKNGGFARPCHSVNGDTDGEVKFNAVGDMVEDGDLLITPSVVVVVGWFHPSVNGYMALSQSVFGFG